MISLTNNLDFYIIGHTTWYRSRAIPNEHLLDEVVIQHNSFSGQHSFRRSEKRINDVTCGMLNGTAGASS